MKNRIARTAGFFYLMVFLTGIAALVTSGRLRLVAGIVAGACYVVVTLLFYFIFRPVNGVLSLLAAMISFVGCLNGPLKLFPVNSLVFFGFYCLLIGYLILRSTFLPRALGVLMMIAGLGWLTFLWPPLANSLYPWILFPGMIGEGALTLWLIVFGVNSSKSNSMFWRSHGIPHLS